MSAMVDPELPADQTAIGVYPETVAIIQRNQIIDETAQNFKFDNNGKT